jgi:hypothetical protein
MHGGRLKLQKMLGIRPVMGTIIGSLMMLDTVGAAAAFGASAHDVQISSNCRPG